MVNESGGWRGRRCNPGTTLIGTCLCAMFANTLCKWLQKFTAVNSLYAVVFQLTSC